MGGDAVIELVVLLALGLAEPSSCSASWLTSWRWDAYPGAAGYLLCTSADAGRWRACDCEALEASATSGEDRAGVPLPGELVFVAVLAVDAAGGILGSHPTPAALAACPDGGG